MNDCKEKLFFLFEAAHGLAVFEFVPVDGNSHEVELLQESFQDFIRLARVVKLLTFHRFSSVHSALLNITALCDGEITDELQAYLQRTLQKTNRNDVYRLGVCEAQLGMTIKEKTGICCVNAKITTEIFRGIRSHFQRFIPGLPAVDICKSQLGLAHAFSRAKVKFDVKKADHLITQAITLMDTLEKDVEMFTMRIKEWYGWHFPELVRIVSNNQQYVKVVLLLGNLAKMNHGTLSALTKITAHRAISIEIVEAARTSLGHDLLPIDLINITTFATHIIRLMDYVQKLRDYVTNKMHIVAPNLSALIGEVIGARLISNMGSLVSLAKCPSSTVQILGAEQAFFSALKKKRNTPEYGLIFQSSLIGKASHKSVSRISRYLGNKCSIAARIDAFMENFTTDAFGRKLRDQVEKRILLDEGSVYSKKNATVMKEALKSLVHQNNA